MSLKISQKGWKFSFLSGFSIFGAGHSGHLDETWLGPSRRKISDLSTMIVLRGALSGHSHRFACAHDELGEGLYEILV